MSSASGINSEPRPVPYHTPTGRQWRGQTTSPGQDSPVKEQARAHAVFPEQLSTLSLEDKMPLASALTAEHLELLEAINQQQTLWMVIQHNS
jgi:hypothetical protein